MPDKEKESPGEKEEESGESGEESGESGEDEDHGEEEGEDGSEEGESDEEETASKKKDAAGEKGLVKSLRRENGKKRIENKKLRGKIASYEDALAVVDKRMIRGELKTEALRAGLVDVDALKMFDTSGLQVSEDGDVEGIGALVTAMKKKKPYLFKENVADTSVNSGTPAQKGAKPKSVRNLKKEDYEREKAKDLAAIQRNY